MVVEPYGILARPGAFIGQHPPSECSRLTTDFAAEFTLLVMTVRSPTPTAPLNSKESVTTHFLLLGRPSRPSMPHDGCHWQLHDCLPYYRVWRIEVLILEVLTVLAVLWRELVAW